MLKVAYRSGEGQHFRFHSTADGTLKAGTQEQPVRTDVSGDEVWNVTSVDGSGNATVDVTLSNLHAQVQGLPQQGSTTQTTTNTVHMQYQVAPDGQILSSAGSQIGGSPLTSAPGGDQFLSLLPDHPVKPGDTWTKTITRNNPFGSGAVNVETTNRFTRYETVSGHQDAVVDTRASVPIDLTVDLQQVEKSLSPPPATSVGGTGRYQGTIESTSTTWLDPKTNRVDRVTSTSNTNLTTTIQTSAGSAGPFTFTGKQTLNLDRVT